MDSLSLTGLTRELYRTRHGARVAVPTLLPAQALVCGRGASNPTSLSGSTSALCTRIPRYIKQLFADAGTRPLRCVVVPANDLINESIAKQSAFQTPPAASFPIAALDAAETSDGLEHRRKRTAHLRIWSGRKEIVVDACECGAGTQPDAGGLGAPLFHDVGNREGERAFGYNSVRGKLVLLIQSLESISTQKRVSRAAKAVKRCEEGGALGCVLVSTVAGQLESMAKPENMSVAGIPSLVISMRDGSTLLRLLTVASVSLPCTMFGEVGTGITLVQQEDPEPLVILEDGVDLEEESSGDQYPGLIVSVPNRPQTTLVAGVVEFGNYLPEEGLQSRVFFNSADPTLASGFPNSSLSKVRGAIVITTRGGIRIAEKAARCEAAGAIGCVVANTEPGAGPFQVGYDESDPEVTIPTLTIGTEEGNVLIDSCLTTGLALTMYVP